MDPEIQKIMDEIKVFDKLCDTVRLVDPLRKSVVSHTFRGSENCGVRCFDFWGKNKVCDNCISMRAFNDDETYVKIEYNDSKTYMITTLPYLLDGRKVVIEMLKDITSSLSISSGDSTEPANREIHAMIDSMNTIAFKDSLTGAFNRRYINEKLPVDMLSSVLASLDLSIIMVDIDNFKKVNDTFGHLIGDSTLKQFTGILSGCIKRGTDWLARYGGEEFLVCLPGADLAKAAEIAGRMRYAVESNDIISGSTRFRITAEFGVCNAKLHQCENIDHLIRIADEKLYLAKQNGRNRVES